MKYKNLVNQRGINEISNAVKRGNKTRNQGLVEAYNKANIEYRTRMTGYYPTMVKNFLIMLRDQKVITTGQMLAFTKDRAMRTLVRGVVGKAPSRPPCVKIQNARGRSNAYKAIISTRRAAASAAASALSTPLRAASSVMSRLRRAKTKTKTKTPK
jgi:hypothetical protein